ncbi:hypothetical protein C8Q72DRAFT_887194 [Fomitopsis betulina]|nr:hypothetical protein C8Q72DRAFT_887194 [Fomitopsis betulina]
MSGETSVKPAAELLRYCEFCGKDVNLAGGGESNWNGHVSSKAHVAAVKSKAAAALKLKTTRKITSFFRPADAVTLSMARSSVPGPARILHGSSEKAAEDHQPEEHADNQSILSGAPEASQSATPIDELRELMRKISHTFPPPSDSLVSLFKFTPVRCKGPACGQWFHYACVNLTAAPEDTDWFCDDDCRANAGVRVRKGPRKKKKIN